MQLEAVRLIDSGLEEAIRWSVESDPEGKSSLFGPELGLSELRSLSASLRNPANIDIEEWAYALAIFQSHVKARPQGGEIDIVEILLGLDSLKSDAEIHELENAPNLN